MNQYLTDSLKEVETSRENADTVFTKLVTNPMFKTMDPKERNFILLRVHKRLQAYLEADGIKFTKR